MGFGGLTLDKIFVILLIALFLIGPEKLPGYAKRLGEFVRSAKKMADGAKDRLRDEMGPEFDDVNWKQLDPRQYDPRRIIRDALLEDEKEAQVEARKAKALEAARARRERVQARAEAVAAGAAVSAGAAGVAAGVAGAADVTDRAPEAEGAENLDPAAVVTVETATSATGMNFDDEAT